MSPLRTGLAPACALVQLSRDAILCPECDALWQREEDVGSATFEDYGTFLVRHGRQQPEEKGEIAFCGDLLRKD